MSRNCWGSSTQPCPTSRRRVNTSGSRASGRRRSWRIRCSRRRGSGWRRRRGCGAAGGVDGDEIRTSPDGVRRQPLPENSSRRERSGPPPRHRCALAHGDGGATIAVNAKVMPRRPSSGSWSLTDRPLTPEWPRRLVDLRLHPPHHPGMDRRRFLLTSLAGALARPPAAEAQKAGKVYRVGVLTGSAGHTPRTEAFRTETSAQGFTEGQNVSHDASRLGVRNRRRRPQCTTLSSW